MIPDPTLRSRLLAISRWSAAFVFVGLAHGGAVWAALDWRASTEAPLGSSPVVMIELAPMAVAPIPAAPEIAPAAPAAPEPTAADPLPEPEIAALPDIPSPVVIPVPEPIPPKPIETIEQREKKRETPKVEKKRQPKDERQKPATASTAAPPSDARADRAAAGTPGTAEAASTAIASWRSLMYGHIGRFTNSRRSFRGADRRRVLLSFSVDRSGRVLSSSVARSSGDPSFDDEAIRILHSASPVPPPPAEMKGTRIDVTAPFQL